MAQVHAFDQVAVTQRLGTGRNGHPSGLDEIAVIGVGQRLLHKLLHQQDRQAVRAKPGSNIENPVDDDGSETAGRLVENQAAGEAGSIVVSLNETRIASRRDQD